MPLFKGQGCKSSPEKAIKYITDPNKAVIISSQSLDDNRSYAEQFRETGNIYGKGKGYDERKYYHFKLSCDPKDKVTPETSHTIAEKMAQQGFAGHECIIATHTDKSHVHSHIIVNAVNYETGKKIHLNNLEYGILKDKANDIGEEYGLTKLDWRKSSYDRVMAPEKHIILRGGTSWKEELKDVIKESLNQSSSFIEFRNHLEKYRVTIERNTEKTISFKHPEREKAIRGERLGEDYTKGAITNGINQQRNGQTSSRTGIDERIKRTESNRAGKQPTQGEFNRVYGTIREIEERAKRFSPTVRAEITARDAEERAVHTGIDKSDNITQESKRVIERKHEYKHRIPGLSR